MRGSRGQRIFADSARSAISQRGKILTLTRKFLQGCCEICRANAQVPQILWHRLSPQEQQNRNRRRMLVPFLDYADERIFLRKVGGGYVFVHRMLMEYFASVADLPWQPSADVAQPQPPASAPSAS